MPGRAVSGDDDRKVRGDLGYAVRGVDPCVVCGWGEEKTPLHWNMTATSIALCTGCYVNPANDYGFAWFEPDAEAYTGTRRLVQYEDDPCQWGAWGGTLLMGVWHSGSCEGEPDQLLPVPLWWRCMTGGQFLAAIVGYPPGGYLPGYPYLIDARPLPLTPYCDGPKSGASLLEECFVFSGLRWPWALGGTVGLDLP